MSDSADITVGGSKNHLYADVGIGVAAVLAIAVTIYHPGSSGFFGASSLWTLGFAGAGVLFAIASATKMVTVRSPQDYYGGLVLVGLGVLALILSADLPGMRGFAFGPGTAPRLFAIGLALLSFVLACVGLSTDGPHIDSYSFRGLILVTASVFLFAATIRPLGLIPASFLTIMVAAFATTEVRWKESVVWAVVLTAFCAVLFPYGLNLPFQLWPRFW
jgi:putative tricarboxylic transport membrane protein